jgi:hypothetical protein
MAFWRWKNVLRADTLIADIAYEKRRGELVLRLHVRKRCPDEEAPSEG